MFIEAWKEERTERASERAMVFFRVQSSVRPSVCDRFLSWVITEPDSEKCSNVWRSNNLCATAELVLVFYPNPESTAKISKLTDWLRGMVITDEKCDQ